MKENDIRPEKELAEYLRLLEKDISALLDKNRMLRNDLSERTRCFLCKSNDSDGLFVKNGFTYVKCRKCGLVYLNPRLKPEELEKYHRKSAAMKYFQENIIKKTAGKRKKLFQSRADMMKRFVSKGRILDVGSSIGIFLDVAEKNGFSAEGVELNEPACRYAESCGLKVHNKQLEEIRFDAGSFDAITMWELIAFIPDPLGIIKESARILKKNGFLFISTPNTDGFEFRLLGKLHTNFVGPNHINLFNIRNIITLLEKAGFSVVSVTTPGLLDVSTVRNALKAGNDMRIDGFFRNILLADDEHHEHLREELQKWISANNLSGHMMVVAKKI